MADQRHNKEFYHPGWGGGERVFGTRKQAGADRLLAHEPLPQLWHELPVVCFCCGARCCSSTGTHSKNQCPELVPQSPTHTYITDVETEARGSSSEVYFFKRAIQMLPPRAQALLQTKLVPENVT